MKHSTQTILNVRASFTLLARLEARHGNAAAAADALARLAATWGAL